MAYDVTNFSDYIARENKILTKTLFAGGDTGKFAMYMGGIKGSTTVPHLSGEAVLQKGNCATPSGSAVANEVTITVTPFTVFESFCQADLQTKFPNTVIAPGSNNGDSLAPWEEELVNVKIASINEQLELNYWQGTTGGTYTLFVGFIGKIDADGNAVDGNTSSATAITKSNIINLVRDMRTAAPAKVKRSKDFVTLVGDDVFDLYIDALIDANLYHYNPEDAANGVYNIGGGNGKLIKVYGLNGTDRMFASNQANFVVGSDVEGEENVADVFYDKVTDKMYLRVKAKAGVQISNADEIVEFTL
ncbi:MAG: hypothetical protein Q8O62_04470 [Aequorivita sp.]|nr:hypothetical protein [Aequorivita sp.]